MDREEIEEFAIFKAGIPPDFFYTDTGILILPPVFPVPRELPDLPEPDIEEIRWDE
jgi:hypothetical protein